MQIKPESTTCQLKILWLTSSYPRFKTDSASIFLQNLANNISAKKHEIHILSPDHINIDSTFHEPFITKHNFQYFFPRRLQKLAYGSGILPNLKNNKWLYLQAPFFIIALFFSTWRLIRQINPAIIHAHWIFPQGFVAVILGKAFNIPVITTAHGGDAFSLKNSILEKIKRWTIQNCTAWSSNTNATANAFGNKIPLPNIIPMGIDFKKFSSGNSEFLRSNIAQNTLILLFVGRLVEKKGVSDLLTAYSLFSDDQKNKTLLWIVGDGSERKTLEEQAQSLKIKNNVTFWGKLPNEQLPNYYAAADIFIAPSITDSSGDTEGQGVMLLESMASGTAIVSTNTGGISEVIDDHITGLLPPPKHPLELKSAIFKLIENTKLRQNIAKKGQLAAQAYDWSTIS
ncbi:MAG: glycosyltransferase, partial [Methylomarinum sp.]|nr:glycosyltransferase [Methylomarinum sp.]